MIFWCQPKRGHVVTRLRRTVAFVTVASVLGLGIVIYAQQDAADRRVHSPESRDQSREPSSIVNVTDDVLRRAGAANDALPGAWLSYGRTQGETRYSTLKQIDRPMRSGWAWRGRTSWARAAATRKARR